MRWHPQQQVNFAVLEKMGLQSAKAEPPPPPTLPQIRQRLVQVLKPFTRPCPHCQCPVYYPLKLWTNQMEPILSDR